MEGGKKDNSRKISIFYLSEINGHEFVYGEL